MFVQKDIKSLDENFIKIISQEYMLVASGDESGYNMMTASWGGVGEMWRRDVAVAVIRPSRYTNSFVEKNDYFTLSFYGDDVKNNREIHKICGSRSGRDTDKAKLTGLTPVFSDGGVYFEQARLVLVCKKLYAQPLQEQYVLSDEVKAMNTGEDYHIAYIAEIVKTLVRE